MSKEFWRGRKIPTGSGSGLNADFLDGHDTSYFEPADATILKQADVDDTPVNGVTTAPISSNWAFDHNAAANPHNTGLSDVSDYVQDQAQQFLHGFPNRTSTTLAFDNTEHIFTLGVATTAVIYLNGIAYTLASPGLTLDLDSKPLSAGLWFIWAEISAGAAVLNAAKSVWSILDLTKIPVATIYWNGTSGAICDERHGANRNLALHAYLHQTVGARVQNDGSFAQTRPSIANDSTLQLAPGSLWDEDIENVISTAQGKLCRLWYETASGVWTFTDGVDNGGYDRPVLWNSGTSRVQFPESDNAYALADGSNANYIPVWVYASNDIARPIYIVTPALTAGYNSVGQARNATAPVIPFAAEVKLLYRWIYRGDGDYQEAADYRTASSLPSGGVASPAAVSVSFAPSGSIAETNVQAAIEELDDEKLAIATTASQAEMEAGTETAVRALSPVRIAQAIAALAPDNYAKYLVALNFGAEL